MFKISSELCSKFNQNYLQNLFNARRFMNVNNQACFQKILQIYAMSETEFNMKEKRKKEIPYKGCVLFNAEVCGPFKRQGKYGMFKVTDLNADIPAHFKAVKVYSNGYINLKCLGHQPSVS